MGTNIHNWEKLDAHQKAGVQWILSRPRSYLAHAPGAGKTIQAIVAGETVPAVRLVVCPPLLTENWRREIRIWGRSPALVIDPENLAALDTCAETWWILADSRLADHALLERLTTRRFIRFLAVDEASRFKESESERTRALFGGHLKNGFLSKGLVAGTDHAVLLDGSPMPNRPRELWAPTFAMAPEAIDHRPLRDFEFRYCGPRVNRFGQYEFKWSSNEDELRRKLTRSFMHVVQESELEHPERRRRVVFLDHDARTKKMIAWERAREHFAFDEEVDAHEQELALRKVSWVAKYVHARLQRDERLLVFFWHRVVGEALREKIAAAELAPVPLIDGSTSMEYRRDAFQMFQNGGNRVIVGNIASMGRGVNLQRADRIIFVEYSWSDETNKQAEKRASRRGSKRVQIPCDYICAPDSLDEIKLKVLFRKQKLVGQIIKGVSQWAKS